MIGDIEAFIVINTPGVAYYERVANYLVNMVEEQERRSVKSRGASGTRSVSKPASEKGGNDYFLE